MFRDGNLSQIIDKAAFPIFGPHTGLELHLSAKFSCGIMHGAYIKPEPSSSSCKTPLAYQLTEEHHLHMGTQRLQPRYHTFPQQCCDAVSVLTPSSNIPSCFHDILYNFSLEFSVLGKSAFQRGQFGVFFPAIIKMN